MSWPFSSAPIKRREKIYCDKWIHEGVCAFNHLGCKYKHEIPIPFRADEAGSFDPDLDESHGDRDMVTIGKDLWFRDVFLFTGGLKTC